jgi:Fe2+ or Zn2+ uptake regulation protein
VSPPTAAAVQSRTAIGSSGDRPAGDLEAILARLRERGHRISRTCRAVVEILLEAPGAVSAPFIANGAGDRPALDKPTVYRNLECLEAIGAVAQIHVGPGPSLYVLTP